MKYKLPLAIALSTVLAFAPLSQAQAHHSGGSGDALAVGILAAGLTTAALAMAAPSSQVYVAQPPAPVYVAPAPVYYAYPPMPPPRPYYHHRHMVRYEPHHRYPSHVYYGARY